MHSTISCTLSTLPAYTAAEWSLLHLGGVAALATSLHWVHLSASELALARTAAVVGATAGSTTSLATSDTSLLASLHGVDLATCEL